MKRFLLLFAAGICGGAIGIMLHCSFMVVKAGGCLMLPDIEPEQRVIVSCLARNIDKGDIVALYPDYFNLESEGSIVFRRVIAAEGDRLTLDWDMETLSDRDNQLQQVVVERSEVIGKAIVY